jgi:hypothetical protein
MKDDYQMALKKCGKTTTHQTEVAATPHKRFRGTTAGHFV